MRPLTNEEALAVDAADSRTKRGGKLEKERNTARSKAKVWLIFFILSIIFYASLHVSEGTPTPKCQTIDSCSCLDLFSALYTAHLLIMLFYAIFRIRIGCQGSKVKMTRRLLKVQSRKVDLTFSILFLVITSIMLVSFLLDITREECQNDARFNKMNSVAKVIMFLVGIHSIF